MDIEGGLVVRRRYADPASVSADLVCKFAEVHRHRVGRECAGLAVITAHNRLPQTMQVRRAPEVRHTFRTQIPPKVEYGATFETSGH